MSLHSAPTTKDNVVRYLLAAYKVDEAEINQALTTPAAIEAIRHGAAIRSFAGYVADHEIAANYDWEENLDFDPDAEEDEEW